MVLLDKREKLWKHKSIKNSQKVVRRTLKLGSEVTFLKVEEIIQAVIKICNEFQAKEVVLYGSRAKGTARERSDIDIAVSGVNDFDLLVEKIEDLPTLYSVDVLNMDTCRNELLMEDVRKYGRKIL